MTSGVFRNLKTGGGTFLVYNYWIATDKSEDKLHSVVGAVFVSLLHPERPLGSL